MTPERDEADSPTRDWRWVLRRIVPIAAGAFLVGYLGAAVWMRSGAPDRGVTTVPDLRESPLSDAEREASDASLLVETIDSLPHPSTPRGQVLLQSPLPGQEVAPGSVVQVILSSGPARHVVPQVSGLSMDRAADLLRASGMEPEFVTVPDLSQEGSVVGTDPPAGTLLEIPARLQLRVSSGPPMVEVPDLVGLHESELEGALAAAMLEVGEITYELRLLDEEGRVFAQEPAAGDSIPAGSTVDVQAATLRLELPDFEVFR